MDTENKKYENERTTSFSEFEKRLDYSLLSDPNKVQRKYNQKIFQRVSIIGCGLILLVGVGIGGNYLLNLRNKRRCPIEEGTYVYSSVIGELNDLDFNAESYIVISDDKLEGPGTFTIQNEKQDWIVYGQFYNCELEESKENFVGENKVFLNNSQNITIAYSTIDNNSILSVTFAKTYCIYFSYVA